VRKSCSPCKDAKRLPPTHTHTHHTQAIKETIEDPEFAHYCAIDKRIKKRKAQTERLHLMNETELGTQNTLQTFCSEFWDYSC